MLLLYLQFGKATSIDVGISQAQPQPSDRVHPGFTSDVGEAHSPDKAKCKDGMHPADPCQKHRLRRSLSNLVQPCESSEVFPGCDHTAQHYFLERRLFL